MPLNTKIGDRWPDKSNLATIRTWDPDFYGANAPGGDFYYDYDPSEPNIQQQQNWTGVSGWASKNPFTDTWIQTWIRTDYVGLTRDKDGGYTVRWLWVKTDQTVAGGSSVDHITCKAAVFYYAYKYEFKGWLGWASADELKFKQYASEPWGISGEPGYLAITTAQADAWDKGSDKRTISGPFLTEEDRADYQQRSNNARAGAGPGARGGKPRPDADYESNMPTTITNSGASRALFEEAMGYTNRLTSPYEDRRAAMEAIMSGVVTRQPRSSITSGGTGSGNMGWRIDKALRDAGYTETQIEWFHEGGVTDPDDVWGLAYDRAGSTTFGDSSPQPPAITPPTPSVTRIVVRGPVGYTEPAARSVDSRPYIQQVFKGQQFRQPDRHYFHNIPNTVSYQGLGSRWVEIPRKGDFPIVEWSDWALMKVSFDFLIAHEMDGLYRDVKHDLDQLRRMAQRPYPVSVFGLDQLFNIQMKRAQSTGRAMQFVIANFTVKSARRTVGEGDKEIAAAQCSMTLQEIPIENMKIIEMTMPPLSGSSIPAPPGDDNGSSPDLPSLLPGVQSNVDAGSILTE